MVAGPLPVASSSGPPATGGSTTCSTARATCPPGPGSGSMAITFYVLPVDRRRQRHHRHALPPVDQRHHRTCCGCWCSSGRRSPSCVTKRICLGLQRKDREKVLHGRETGRVFRTAEGEVFELHEPLDPDEPAGCWSSTRPSARWSCRPPSTTNGVRRPGSRFGGLRRAVSRFYFEDRVEPVTPAELAAAHDGHEISGDGHGGHEASAPRPRAAGPATPSPAVTDPDGGPPPCAAPVTPLGGRSPGTCRGEVRPTAPCWAEPVARLLGARVARRQHRPARAATDSRAPRVLARVSAASLRDEAPSCQPVRHGEALCQRLPGTGVPVRRP